jgi:O-antigen/teichoic acid export membrane protein
LVCGVILTIQNIALSRQQTKEAYWRYNLISIARPFVLLIILSILYLFNQLNFWTASVSFLVSILAAVYSELIGNQSIFKIKGIRFQVRQFLWFWQIAKPLVLFFFIRGTMDLLSFFFVSRYFSLEEIANFSVPFRYYAMADLIIVTTHIPFINKFSKETFPEGMQKFKKWIRFTGVLALAGLAVLPFVKPIFVLLSGAQYELAFPYFCIFMVGLVPYLLFSPSIYGLIGRGAFKLLLILALTSFFIHICLCWYGSVNQNLSIITFSTIFARGFIYIASSIALFRKK